MAETTFVDVSSTVVRRGPIPRQLLTRAEGFFGFPFFLRLTEELARDWPSSFLGRFRPATDWVSDLFSERLPQHVLVEWRSATSHLTRTNCQLECQTLLG
jgi:hypothetical protein